MKKRLFVLISPDSLSLVEGTIKTDKGGTFFKRIESQSWVLLKGEEALVPFSTSEKKIREIQEKLKEKRPAALLGAATGALVGMGMYRVHRSGLTKGR